MRAEYICPVLTAFDENGKVDMEAMKRQFDHLIEGGLNGIAIMGSSGEFYAMTLEEAMAFARDSIAYLKGKIPVYIGTGRLIADETIQFSNYVLDQGATAVMIVGPYYIGTDDAGVEEYYDYVAERINGNIILYNFPDRTGFDLSLNVILQLLKKHKNIIGLKDTFGAPSHTRTLIGRIKPEYPEFRIYSGYDDNFAHVVSSGGDGCIAALSNVFPKLCSEWVDAVEHDNMEKTAQIQQTIDALMDFYAISTPFMPAMKYGLSVIGIPFPLTCKRPALEVTEGQKQMVNGMLKEIISKIQK